MNPDLKIFEDLIKAPTSAKIKNRVLNIVEDQPNLTVDSLRQMKHYDTIHEAYRDALSLPQTQAYTSYMDQKLLSYFQSDNLGDVAEICCGCGEAFKLIASRVNRGIGVDISSKMLEAATNIHSNSNFLFIHADALDCPLKDNKFDYVVMLGGIHHINNRKKLFSEVYRILKPGGQFFFREPANDFFLWKALRSIIYRISPNLDHETEAPLTYEKTVPLLQNIGFTHVLYRNYTFLGFCLFMNADVLKFNKYFKHMPGIQSIVKVFIQFDDFFTNLKPFKRLGLQVIGVARKT